MQERIQIFFLVMNKVPLSKHHLRIYTQNANAIIKVAHQATAKDH